MAVIKQWAKQSDVIDEATAHEDKEGMPRLEDDSTIQRENDGEDLRVSFVKSVSFSSLAASLQAHAVCPFCVYATIANQPEKMSDTEFSSYIRQLMPKPDNSAWIQACARAHNREMHSSNGNIDNDSNFTGWEQLVALDSPTIEAYKGPEAAVLVNKAHDNTLPKVYNTDRTLRGTQASTNVGTFYQYTCQRAILQDALDARLQLIASQANPDVGARGLDGWPDIRPRMVVVGGYSR